MANFKRGCGFRTSRTRLVPGTDQALMSAVLTFGVTELAVARAQAVEHHVQPKVRSLVPTFVKTIFTNWVTKTFLKNAEYFANQAVWFEGARARLAQEHADGSVAIPDDLRVVLESLEVRLLTIREGSLKFLGELEQGTSSKGVVSVIDALRAHLHALSDFYEALVAFKWAAMELDADREISTGNVASFDSVQALLADLAN